MPSISSLVFAVALAAVAAAHPISHEERVALPDATWFHEVEHPVHGLFRRADAPAAAPKVGSDDWKKAFPARPAQPGTLPTTEKDLPAAWVAAYKAAVANGKIPAIPPTTADYNAGTAKYPAGLDPSSREICSTYEQCYTNADFVNPRSGQIAISFDDGPADGTETLLNFLGPNHIRATHFLIGSNILDSPDLFSRIFAQGGDLAVHTYTHPYMTSLSDYGVLAELGWTMQIIHDSTGGRVPKFWRPPFGDSDNRIRAIALEVFGLRAVMWNQDTNDWAMPTGQTPEAIRGNETEWLSGDKVKAKDGLMILEHELTVDTANVFINTTWPLLKQFGWNPVSVAQIWGNGAAYTNAKGNTDAPTSQDVASSAKSVTLTKTSTLPPWATAVPTQSTTASSTGAPAPGTPVPSAPAPGAPVPSAPAPGAPAPSAPAPGSPSGGSAGSPSTGGSPPSGNSPSTGGTGSGPITPPGGGSNTNSQNNASSQAPQGAGNSASGLTSSRSVLAATVAVVVAVLA